MKIETKASTLLDTLYFLSKISRLNENNKSLLLNATDELTAYASSGLVYGQSKIDCRVIESGKALLPLVILPTIAKLKDAVIELDVTLDEIKITSGVGVITQNQYGGYLDEVSIKANNPEWLGIDLIKLKNIKYAVGNFNGLDNFWVYDSIIATDKYQIAIYRPAKIEQRLMIPVEVVSYLPTTNTKNKESNPIDLAVEDKSIWFGNHKQSIQFGKPDNFNIPGPLAALSTIDADQLENFVTVNTKSLQLILSLLKGYSDKDNLTCRVEINKDVVNFSTAISSGSTNLNVSVIEENLNEPMRIKVNVNYLNNVVTNCTGHQVLIGLIRLGTTPLLFIHDYDVTHFIVTMV